MVVDRLQSSAGLTLRPEVTTSSLKVLPGTVLDRFPCTAETDIGSLALRLEITDSPRK